MHDNAGNFGYWYYKFPNAWTPPQQEKTRTILLLVIYTTGVKATKAKLAHYFAIQVAQNAR